MKNFFDLQKKKLEIDETNARSRAMEAKQALLAEESRIMVADLNTMTPRKRAWVEKKQKLLNLWGQNEASGSSFLGTM